MSKVRQQFDWTKTSEFNQTPRTRKYPWDVWLDGRIHELFPGVDFDGNAQSLTSVARTTANRKKVRIRVRVIANEASTALIDEMRTKVEKAKGERMTLDKATVARLLDLASGLDGSTVVLQQHDDEDGERGITRSPSKASLSTEEPSTNGKAKAPAKRARRRPVAPVKAGVSKRPATAKKVAPTGRVSKKVAVKA